MPPLARRPRPTWCSSPAHGQKAPAGARYWAAAVTAQSRPGSSGPAAARWAGVARAKDGPERRREVAALWRWPCKAGRRQRSAPRSLRRSAAGLRCLPRAGARERRGRDQEERCCRRSKCCLVCGRQRAGGGDGRKQEVVCFTGQPLGLISARGMPRPAQPKVRWQLWERWIRGQECLGLGSFRVWSRWHPKWILSAAGCWAWEGLRCMHQCQHFGKEGLEP